MRAVSRSSLIRVSRSFNSNNRLSDYEPQFYENGMNFLCIPYERHFMAPENCKMKFHAKICDHEFAVKSVVFYFVTLEFHKERH